MLFSHEEKDKIVDLLNSFDSKMPKITALLTMTEIYPIYLQKLGTSACLFLQIAPVRD